MEQLVQNRMAVHNNNENREVYFISPHTTPYRRTILEDLKFFNECGLEIAIPPYKTNRTISQRIDHITNYKFSPLPIPIKITFTINPQTNKTQKRTIQYYARMYYQATGINYY